MKIDIKRLIKALFLYVLIVCAILFMPFGIHFLCMILPSFCLVRYFYHKIPLLEQIAIGIAASIPLTAVTGFILIFSGNYHTVLFSSIYSLPVLLFYFDSKRIITKIVWSDILSFEGILTILIVIFFLYLSWYFPFTPIFNMDHYNILDFARYLSVNQDFPHLTVDSIFPTAVRAIIYPQNMIMAIIGSLNYSVYFSEIGLIKTMNMVSLFFYFGCACIAYLLFEQKKTTLLFLLILVNVPHIYPAFAKTVTSDTFQLYYSMFFLFLILSIFSYKRTEFIPLLFILLGFSFYLRIFLMGYYLGFLVVFLSLLYLMQRFSLYRFNWHVFLNNKNLSIMLVSFFILISWPTIMLGKFGNPLAPHSAKIGPFKYKLDEQLEEFNTAVMLGNFPSENRLRQIINSVCSNSIYYKTYSNTVDKHTFFATTRKIFGSYFFLVASLFVSILVLKIILNQCKKIPVEILSIALWFITPLALWFFIDEKMATTKYFISSVPVWCFAVVYFLSKYKPHIFQRKTPLILIMLLLFIRVVVLESGNAFANMDHLKFFPSWKESFEKEYGYKLEFIEKCREYGITPQNTLFMVRSEHGGFIIFFLSGNHVWEYKWYDKLSYKRLHIAESTDEVLDILKQDKIQYIISMNQAELERFYVNIFPNVNCSFKEYLVKMIIEKNHNLPIVYTEAIKRGLELTFYKVTYK